MGNAIDDLIRAVDSSAIIERVAFGLHWTAVITGGRCGIASSMYTCRKPVQRTLPPMPPDLIGRPAARAIALLTSPEVALRSLAMATLNACLPVPKTHITEENAFDILGRKSQGKTVAIIGHFPGVEALRKTAGECFVLELNPAGDDIPASRAPEILPRAQVVGLSATTLLNGTFSDLMRLIAPGAFVIMLGPTTPLAPVLFNYGINVLSGAIITDAQAAIEAAETGANFRQLKRYTHLINLWRDFP